MNSISAKKPFISSYGKIAMQEENFIDISGIPANTASGGSVRRFAS
jgi:hypothetical protein